MKAEKKKNHTKRMHDYFKHNMNEQFKNTLINKKG